MTYISRILPAHALPLTPQWRSALIPLAGLWLAILLLFARDSADIVSIWWTSSTFSHCVFIPPIIGWLVWMRWPRLSQLTPRGWWPGLTVVGAGACGWLLGDAAGVGFARHLGLALMLQGSVVTLLGPKVSRALAFPLFYMFFMVPFGEELVPPLQTVTAKICMIMLGWTGIPAHIDGIFITTPGGYFEVAAACAGVNFLIAMVAYGALAANLCFRNWGRRIGFMVFAIATSIIANGIRAFGTIYISQRAGIDFAAGFDHIFYGWIFFALAVAIVIGAGWRFFDRAIDDPWFDPELLKEPARTPPNAHLVAAAILATILAPVAWSGVIAATGRQSMPNPVTLPDVPGWTRADHEKAHPWFPRFEGADHRLLGRYRNARGDIVDLAVILYAWQDEGREVVSFGQGAADSVNGWAWTRDTPPPPAGKAERIVTAGPLAREVLSFYRVGAVTLGSPTAVKLQTLRVRLLGGSQRAAVVLVSAEDHAAKPARPAIDRFLADLGPVDQLADGIADHAIDR